MKRISDKIILSDVSSFLCIDKSFNSEAASYFRSRTIIFSKGEIFHFFLNPQPFALTFLEGSNSYLPITQYQGFEKAGSLLTQKKWSKNLFCFANSLKLPSIILCIFSLSTIMKGKSQSNWQTIINIFPSESRKTSVCLHSTWKTIIQGFKASESSISRIIQANFSRILWKADLL